MLFRLKSRRAYIKKKWAVPTLLFRKIKTAFTVNLYSIGIRLTRERAGNSVNSLLNRNRADFPSIRTDPGPECRNTTQ